METEEETSPTKKIEDGHASAYRCSHSFPFFAILSATNRNFIFLSEKKNKPQHPSSLEKLALLT
jgi:hypothetical protein